MRQKSVTVRQIQDLDKLAIEKYGVPSLALMENAGCSVAKEIIKLFKKPQSARVCIFCGLGNNAGDGFVIARHLINAGAKVKIFLIGKAASLKYDAAVNYKILKKLKYPVKEVKKLQGADLKSVARADIVVDAIFGVGLNRAIKEPFYHIIETVNKRAKRVIAVDTPSGLSGTTGEVYGICIKAHKTVTFSFIKKGFLKAQGPRHTGKVVVIDIGIPLSLKKRIK